MKYNSTRNRSVSVSAAQAIAQGISADGGLFVPEVIPQLPQGALEQLKDMTYQPGAEDSFRFSDGFYTAGNRGKRAGGLQPQ